MLECFYQHLIQFQNPQTTMKTRHILQNTSNMPGHYPHQSHIINMPTNVIEKIIKMMLKNEYSIIDIKTNIYIFLISSTSLYKDYTNLGKERVDRIVMNTIQENYREKETKILKSIGKYLLEKGEITKLSKDNLNYLSEQEFWKTLIVTDEKKNYRYWAVTLNNYYNEWTQDQLKYIDYWINSIIEERQLINSPISSPNLINMYPNNWI